MSGQQITRIWFDESQAIEPFAFASAESRFDASFRAARDSMLRKIEADAMVGTMTTTTTALTDAPLTVESARELMRAIWSGYP